MTNKGTPADTKQNIQSIRTKILFCILALHTLVRFAVPCQGNTPDAGFSLPEDISEVTFRYRTYNNLIVLPVTINDSIKVNLILDTGCRNVLLFGKRLQRVFETLPDHEVRFSGLGEKSPLTGKLSLNNKVMIESIVGKKIPIVILPDRNIFMGNSNIDGIIGYDIFIRLEVELNSSSKQITFRAADRLESTGDFTKVPLEIKDTRPLVRSNIFFSGADGSNFDIMLDTGSVLGLLIRSDSKKYFNNDPQQILGKGLSGNLRGTAKPARKMVLDTFEISIREVKLSRCVRPKHGSVGMAIMKDYTMVLNYCKGYVGFKNSKHPKQLI